MIFSCIEAKRYLEGDPGVKMSNFTEIDISGANYLASEFEPAEHFYLIDFDKVNFIDEETAKALSAIPAFFVDSHGYESWHGLGLDGLLSISDKVAYHLSKFEGYLSLNGLTQLSPDSARFLGEFKYGLKSLELDGLESVSSKVAASLGKLESVSLNALHYISSECARFLFSHPKHSVELQSLQTLTLEFARELSILRPTSEPEFLSFTGPGVYFDLSAVSIEVVCALAETQVDIHLGSPENFDPDLRAIIEEYDLF